MIMIANIRNICFLGNLGENTLFFGEVVFLSKKIMSLRNRSLNYLEELLKPFFSLRNNHVLKEKEFKLPQGATQAIFSLGNNHVLKVKLS